MNELTEQRIKQAIRRKFMRRIYGTGAVVILAGAVVWVIVIISRKTPVTAPANTHVYENLGQEHIALNDAPPKAYNSNPPTSGGHYASPASWGIYDYEVNDKIFIHNLEHGGIWISYKPSVSPDVVAELKKIVDGFGGVKIVMAPRGINDADVAVASWVHVYKFDISGGHLSDDQKRDIKNFYNALRDHAPEDVPAFMPGVDPKEAK